MLLKITWKLVKNLPRIMLVGAGTGIAYSAFVVDHHMRLPSSLPGSRWTDDDGHGGSMTVYHDSSGEGSPVLLVHSVNAAASSYEMRPLYTRLQGERPVWAIDLPGFGDSERGNRPYSPQMMSRAIGRALETIGRPAHIVALSLGSELAARAVSDAPDLVRSLALISPTGFGRPPRTIAALSSILRFPLWSQAIFDAIASRRSIRYYLSKSFAGPVDEMMLEHAYLTAHQPGARFAPVAFLAGELFTQDAIEGLYANLTVPTTVLYDRDPFTSFTRLPEFLAGREGWDAVRISDTRGLPHWDKPTETINALLAHWAAAGTD